MIRTSLVFVASLFAAGTILAGTASPALAAEPSAPTRVVSYADLNLASAAGRARLEARIDRAIREVCGEAAPVDLNGLAQVQLCRDETHAAADAQWRRGEVLIAVRTGARPAVAATR